MKTGLISAVFAALLLSACAGHGPLPEELEALDKAPVCCAGYAFMKYEPLALGDVQDASLDAAEQKAFTFPTGKSFFRAYAIPRDAGPFYLRLTSIPDSRRVFFPLLLVLDGNYRPVRTVTSPVFDWRNGGFGPTSASIVGTAYFNPQVSGERYVILLTPANAQSQSYRATTAGSVDISQTIPRLTPPGAQIDLEPGPTGQVEIKTGRL